MCATIKAYDPLPFDVQICCYTHYRYVECVWLQQILDDFVTAGAWG